MITLDDLNVRGDPTWGGIRAGDGFTYPDGGLFIIEARAIDDGTYVTLLMRCVVPPSFGDFKYWDLSTMTRSNYEEIPDGCVIVRPT